MANRKLNHESALGQFFEYLLKHRVLYFAVLVLPSVIIYYRTLNFQFSSLDDQWMIVRSKDFLKSWKSLLDAFFLPTDGVFYRPLLTISFIIDYHIKDGSASIFHLSNIFLHLTAVLLLHGIFLRLNITAVTTFILCLWFSIHPLCVSPVAWIPGRNDLLLAVFSLSSTLFLIDFLSSKKWYFLGLHFAFFTLALFTKETAMVLPIVFLAFFFQFKERAAKTIVVSLVVWILILAIYLGVRTQIVPENPAIQNISFASAVGVFKPLIYNFGKVIYPMSQSVLPYNESANWHLGVLSLVVIFYLTLHYKLRNYRTALTGAVLFLITLTPSLLYTTLIGPDIQFEHRLYLPLAGFFLFISQINFPSKHKLWQIITLSILVCSFFTAMKRTAVYQNESSFINAGINESPEYYLFHMQLGDQLSQKNQNSEALHSYDRALILNNKLPSLYNNKAWALFKLGILEKSLSNYNKAIELDSTNSHFRVGRCMVAVQLKDLNLAKIDYGYLLKCCPELISSSFTEKMNALERDEKEKENNPFY